MKAIVVSVHEGGTHDGYYDNCVNPRGPVIDFAKQASPLIDAIFTGHWHAAFNCTIDDPAGNPRPVVEAGYHGKLINDTNVKIDVRTRDIVRSATTSVNRPVTRDVEPDTHVVKMVDYWMARKLRTEARTVATFGGDLTRTLDATGQSTLGNAAADAMLEDSRAKSQAAPADLAIVPNKVHTGSSPMIGDVLFAPGSNAADKPGSLLFGEWMSGFGYANPVLTVTVTGQNIHDALEGQWRANADGTEKFAPLAVSANVRYSYDKAKTIGDRVDPADVLIGGKPLDVSANYRLAGLTYNLIGRDGTAGLTGFTDAVRGSLDRNAFRDYLNRHAPLQPPALDRVTVK